MEIQDFLQHSKGQKKKTTFEENLEQLGVWLDEKGDITVKFIEFQHKQYIQERDATDSSLSRHIPRTINANENLEICKIPKLDKVKNLCLI